MNEYEYDIKTSASVGNVCAYAVVGGKLCSADCNPYLVGETGEWWISRVFVPDKLRGAGIGTKLLECMCKEVVNNGGSKMVVYPGGYYVDGDRQRDFYRRNGFKEVDIGKFIKELKHE